MNMVDVSGYLANVAQIARKTPTATLRHAYLRALREWCQQTQWLRIDLPGSLVAGTRQYSLGNDPHFDIVGIYAMQGTFIATPPSSQTPQIWPITPADSGSFSPNLQPAPPLRYQYVPEAQFSVDPIPDQDYGALVTVILAPKEGAVMVPEAPLIKYSNDIEAGALAYLYQIPGMPWSNPNGAVMKMKEFQSGISNGKAEVQRNYNTGAQRARPRQFLV